MSTTEKLEENLRKLVTFLYSWLSTNGEVLGCILGVWHIIVAVNIVVCIFISHTFYPSFWFQLIVYIFLVLIWLQHIFLKVCIVFLTEMKLTNKEPAYYEVVRNVLGIEPEIITNYILALETSAVVCFGLELTSRCSLWIHEFLRVKV